MDRKGHMMWSSEESTAIGSDSGLLAPDLYGAKNAWVGEQIASPAIEAPDMGPDTPKRRPARTKNVQIGRSKTMFGVRWEGILSEGHFRSHAKEKRRSWWQVCSAGFWPKRENILPNVFAGLISGILFAVNCVINAGMVFNSADATALNAMYPTGIVLNLMSSSVAQLLAMLSFNLHMMACPQGTPGLIFSEISLILVEVIEDKNKLGHTMIALLWISALCLGVLGWLFGRAGAGSVFHRMPSPVVSGFLSTIGVLFVKKAIGLLANVEFDVIWPKSFKPFTKHQVWVQIVLGCYTAFSVMYLGSLIQPHVKRPLLKSIVTPLCLLNPLMLFYIVISFTGRPGEVLDDLRSDDWKWLYDTYDAKPFYSLWSESYAFDKVEWSAIANTRVILNVVILVFMSLLSQVLQIIGGTETIPEPSGEKAELGRELQVTGITNITVGLLGGTVCYHNLTLATVMYKDGGTHRIASFCATALVFVVFLSGAPTSPYIPKFYLGGLYLKLGLSFIKSNLVHKFHQMDWASYSSMVVIVICGLVFNLTVAVGVGILMIIAADLLYISLEDPIYHYATSYTLVSSRLRTFAARKALREHLLLRVIRLRGALFFGNAKRLARDVSELLCASDPDHPKPLHVIVCLKDVTAIDDTAEDALKDIKGTVTNLGARLHFTNISDWGSALAHKGLIPKDLSVDTECPSFELLDCAIKWCEDQILLALEPTLETGVVSARVDEWGKMGHGQTQCHLAELACMSHDHWKQLVGECNILEFSFSDSVYLEGDACSAIYMLASGVVHLEKDKSVIKILQPLAVMGAVDACYDQKMSESAYVESLCGATVYELPLDHFNKLKLLPDTAAMCWSFIDNVLLRQLAKEALDAHEVLG